MTEDPSQQSKLPSGDPASRIASRAALKRDGPPEGWSAAYKSLGSEFDGLLEALLDTYRHAL